MLIKTYCRNQTDLFPIKLDDIIKSNDPVRLLGLTLIFWGLSEKFIKSE